MYLLWRSTSTLYDAFCQNTVSRNAKTISKNNALGQLKIVSFRNIKTLSYDMSQARPGHCERGRGRETPMARRFE